MPPMPQPRSALKFDLFAADARKRKIESLGDPLQIIARHIDFAHLAGLIDALYPRPDAARGGRPPYPTEVMVRVLGSMPFCVELDNLKDTDAPIHQPAAMLVAAD